MVVGKLSTFLLGKSYFQDFREGNSSVPNRKHSNIVWINRVPGGYFFGCEYSLKKNESSLKFPSLPMILIPHSPLSLNSIQTINKQTNNTKKTQKTSGDSTGDPENFKKKDSNKHLPPWLP